MTEPWKYALFTRRVYRLAESFPVCIITPIRKFWFPKLKWNLENQGVRIFKFQLAGISVIFLRVVTKLPLRYNFHFRFKTIFDSQFQQWDCKVTGNVVQIFLLWLPIQITFMNLPEKNKPSTFNTTFKKKRIITVCRKCSWSQDHEIGPVWIGCSQLWESLLVFCRLVWSEQVLDVERTIRRRRGGFRFLDILFFSRHFSIGCWLWSEETRVP